MISDLCCDAGLVLGTLHVLPHLITKQLLNSVCLGSRRPFVPWKV